MDDPTKKVHPCLICNELFITKDGLRFHTLNKHTKRAVTLKTEEELNHNNKNNNCRIPNNIPTKQHRCTICDKRFTTSEGLHSHILSKHSKEKKTCLVPNHNPVGATTVTAPPPDNNVIVRPSKPEHPTQSSTKQKPFTICNKKSATESELKSHMRMKQALEKKRLVIRLVLPNQNHVFVVADQKNTTEVNTATPPENNIIVPPPKRKRPTQTSRKQKPFHCTICDKEYVTESGLETHIQKKHAQEEKGLVLPNQNHVVVVADQKKTTVVKPATPPDNNVIVQPPKRKRPTQTSRKQKPFHCTICNKKSATESGLKSHMQKKHAQEKKRLIVVLNQNPVVVATNQKNTTVVDLHLKRKHTCFICNKEFSTEDGLSEHAINEHNMIAKKERNPNEDKLNCYSCPSCCKVFCTQGRVTAHCNSKHKHPIVPRVSPKSTSNKYQFIKIKKVHQKSMISVMEKPPIELLEYAKTNRIAFIQQSMYLYIPYINIAIYFPICPRLPTHGITGITQPFRLSTQQKSQHQQPHVPKKQPTPILRSFSGSRKRGRKKEIRNDHTLKPYGIKPPWILTQHAKERLRERGPQTLPRYVNGTNKTVVATFVPTNVPKEYRFRSQTLRKERKCINKLINYMAKNGTRTLDRICNVMRCGISRV